MSATPVAAVRRPAPTVILLAGAGVLELVAVILATASAGIAVAIVAGVAALALTAFFVLHAIVKTTMQLTLRIGFVVGAVGWFIIAIEDLVPGGVGYALAGIAYVLAIVGSLVVGIWAYTSRLFGRLANIVFLIAMVLGALYAFDYLLPVLPEVLFLVVWLIFAAALIVSGFFVYRRR